MIVGKVASIVSETEVVLNVGAEHGVKEGVEFVIYATGDPITDPDSGQVLGAIETVKGRVVVSYVMERICRASTTTYTSTVPSPYLTGFGGLTDILQDKTVTKRRVLQVKKEDVHPAPDDKTVRVGDPVRSVER